MNSHGLMSLIILLSLIFIGLSIANGPLHMDGSGGTGDGSSPNENVDGRIIGGLQAKLGQFPYHALLNVQEPNGGNGWCGGALISDRFVVTAAHCAIVSPSIKVTLGTINSVTQEGPKAVSLQSDKPNIFVHPDFDHPNLINDIALVKLPQPVNFSEYIKAVELPKASESPPDTFVGKKAVITGWGLTENDTTELQTILRYAFVNVSENLPCLSYYNQFNINDGRICTQFHGTGTCSGDSGGPMALYNNSSKNHILIGITSFGTLNCTANAPSVYSNVAYYVPWIHKITNITVT